MISYTSLYKKGIKQNPNKPMETTSGTFGAAINCNKTRHLDLSVI